MGRSRPCENLGRAQASGIRCKGPEVVGGVSRGSNQPMRAQTTRGTHVCSASSASALTHTIQHPHYIDEQVRHRKAFPLRVTQRG